MSLRDATEGDLAAINAIYDHYVRHSDCTMQTEATSLEEWREWLSSAIEALVIEEHREVLGWGALVPFSPRGGYQWTVENSVYLRHDARGRGLGKALLAELVRRAQASGLHSIVAKVAATQETSVALHAQFGFVEVGCLREAGFKLGSWLDVVLMQRRL